MWWIQKNKKPEHGVQYNRSKVIKINMIITMMIFILMYFMYISSLCQHCYAMHKQLSADVQPLPQTMGQQ